MSNGSHIQFLYLVEQLNHDMSVSSIIDPIKKIEALLAKRG